jgi:hypothetical protein
VTLPCALLVVAAILTAGPVSVAASAPVAFNVRFGDGARLGASTSMTIDLHVDTRLGPVTEFRLLTPSGVTLTSSQLGAAACDRPATEVVRVMGPVQHHRCPANSLLGTGSATAGLLLDPDEPIFGAGYIDLHAGASVADKPGLLVTVDTYNPARLQLTYAGYLYIPPPPFGVGLTILVPLIPHPPFGADVALATLHLTVGANTITYHRQVRGRRVAYHPGGIPLPGACPRGGFRFRAILRFADGSRRQVDSVAGCPRHARRR